VSDVHRWWWSFVLAWRLERELVRHEGYGWSVFAVVPLFPTPVFLVVYRRPM